MLVGIALFLTIFVMAPTFKAVKEDAIDPLQRRTRSREAQAFERGQKPLREFMFKQTREKDLALFVKLAKIEPPETRADVPTYVLIPAFIISELKTAFQIGFLIFLPFLVIDLVVSQHVDVDGHDHAATGPHLACRSRSCCSSSSTAGTWSREVARGVVRMTTGHRHRARRSTAIELALKVALPLLLVGLVVGLVISVFQAVTQIQEQTLTFIPKILATVAVLVIGGPWMLDQLLAYTTELWLVDPRRSSAHDASSRSSQQFGEQQVVAFFLVLARVEPAVRARAAVQLAAAARCACAASSPSRSPIGLVAGRRQRRRRSTTDVVGARRPGRQGAARRRARSRSRSARCSPRSRSPARSSTRSIGFSLRRHRRPDHRHAVGGHLAALRLLGVLIFIAIGGDAWVIQGLAKTYDIVPLDGVPALGAMVAGVDDGVRRRSSARRSRSPARSCSR